MKERHNINLKNYLIFFGSLIELLVFCLLYYFVWKDNFSVIYSFNSLGLGKYVLVGLYFIILYCTLRFSDGLKFGQLKFTEVYVSQFVSIVATNFITFLQLSLIYSMIVPVVPIILLSGIQFFLALVFSYLFSSIYHTNLVPGDILMVYGTDAALRFKFKADRKGKEFQITKLMKSNLDPVFIESEILKHEAVLINDVKTEIRNDIIKFCFDHDIGVYVVPKISDIIIKSSNNTSLFDTPLYTPRIHGLSMQQLIVKRVFDLVMSIAMLVLCSPLFVVISALIRLEDGGPVFYKQKRVTKNGKVFEILKFRSMIVDAEKDGISVPAAEHDPRITRIGRFIRACRIDELPQLFNIIGGSMSIVGPRPERIEHVEMYKKEIPEFVFREKMKGGLTGYAQVYGKYNTSAYDKIKMDLIYIENYSFLLDLKLIILTIRTIFQRESTEGFYHSDEMKTKTNPGCQNE